MQQDDAPLTKADGKMIMEIMSKMMAHMDELHRDVREEIREAVAASEYRTGLLFENLRRDVLDVRKDQVIQHEDRLKAHDRRIQRVESSLGLAA